MVELLSTKIPGRIAFYKAVLEDAGIQTFIRNEHLSGVEGMIPIFQPALCVVNDADEDRARQLIKDAKLSEDSGDGPEVPCPECSEKNPSNFATCWNCGKILNS
ncbi:MAG: DUF2007 domain-containing protein [Akkermansiaceae bacterium]